MRRCLPWLLALPVMAAGSLGAHSLSYLLIAAHSTQVRTEASERASTASASYLVLFLGILGATTLVAGVARLLLGRRCRRGVEVSPWCFFVLPPLAFVLQEFAERLLHAELFPFHAALEPRFLLGLLLQLPFALLALLIARLLVRVVERLVRPLAQTRKARLRATVSWTPRQVCDLPRIPAPALGYPQRGPPAL